MTAADVAIVMSLAGIVMFFLGMMAPVFDIDEELPDWLYFLARAAATLGLLMFMAGSFTAMFAAVLGR